MTLNSLQAITWGTVVGAVVGALWLASDESGLSPLPHARPGDSVLAISLSTGQGATPLKVSNNTLSVSEQTRHFSPR